MSIVLVDDYSPHTVGDLSPSLTHQFVDANNEPFDLTTVDPTTMTLVLFCPDTAQRKVGGSTWTVPPLTASQGIAVYNWSAPDVATAGIWQMQAGVPFSGLVQHFDIKDIEFIQPL
jgi:hypothetical protein